MIRVLLAAEGPSEFGELDQSYPRRGATRGYIPPILQKYLGNEISVVARKITMLGRFESRHRIPGHGARAAMALALAANDNFDVLVFVKDVDRTSGTRASAKERERKLRQMHSDIEAGFDAVDGGSRVACVKGTPCRMIEAWALGDPKAVRLVARTSAQWREVARPEDLWGNEKQRGSNHPVRVLCDVLGFEPSAATLEEIAEASDTGVLEERLPESFAPFAAELKKTAARPLPARTDRRGPWKEKKVFGTRTSR